MKLIEHFLDEMAKMEPPLLYTYWEGLREMTREEIEEIAFGWEGKIPATREELEKSVDWWMEVRELDFDEFMELVYINREEK